MMRDESRRQKISLFPNKGKTAQQALLDMLNIVDGRAVKDVLILAYDEDDDLLMKASDMTNKDALWLCVSAGIHIMGVSRDE